MKKRFTIFCFLAYLLVSLPAGAQNFDEKQQNWINKYNLIINSSQSHDTSIASAYMQLMGILYLSNIDTIFPLSEKVREVCDRGLANNPNHEEKYNLLSFYAGSYNNEAYAMQAKGDTDGAIEKYTEALLIQQANGEMEGLSICLNNMGQVYELKGEIQTALDHYNKARIIQETNGLKAGLSITLNNIGITYKKQGDYDKALSFYNQSLSIRKELNNEHGIANSLSNIGALHGSKNDNETALIYFQQSLEIRRKINDKSGISNSLNNMAGIYADLEEYETALELFNEALTIRTEMGLKNSISESLIDIAKIYAEQGYMNAAKERAEKAMSIAEELGHPERLEESALLLSTIYEKEGRGQKALDMFKLHVLMSDSIQNEVIKKATIEQDAKFEYEKQKVVDDIEHEKELLYEQEEQQKQQIIIWAAGIGLFLFAGFLIFVFNRLQITRKQKNEIDQQKNEIEHAHEALGEKNQEILDSINYALRIQKAILPPDSEINKALPNSFVFYKPKDIVAGDFYWLEKNQNKVLFAAADCTGHGVPGAMVSVICNNALNRSVREFGLTEPGKILDQTRKIVIEEFEKSADEVKDGMDIALCMLDGFELQYSGANNPLWILRAGEILETKANKQPIGKFDKIVPYQTHQMTLQPGDLLYIFSDGFADQFGGPKGKKFKSENFKRLLIKIKDLSIKKQQVEIESAFNNWKGDLEQLDDICVIGVKL